MNKSIPTSILRPTYRLCFYFNSSSQLNTLNLPINDYLRQQLIRNHIYQIKQFQYDMLMDIQAGHHCFLNSCTGSGKTLAYLLPILSKLIDQNQTRKASSQESRKPPHGAIILTLNKQLCLQGYRTTREYDQQQHLNISRTGPISHFIPVVKQLSNYTTANDQLANKIDTMISYNLVNVLKWNKNDIVFSTPQLLRNVLELGENKLKGIQEFVCPQFVVIDEADLLLEIDKNVSRSTFAVIDRIRRNVEKIGKMKGEKIDKTKTPQFIISASSFPNKLGKLEYQQGLNSLFPGIKIIQGQHLHQIPPQIDLYSIQTEKMPKSKLYYINDILSKRKQQRIIIFCNSRDSILEVSSAIKAFDQSITHDVYYATLDSNQRSRVLHRFEKGETSVLISTDLGSRGLDFKIPVNLIIEYEMAENVTGFLNRVGRTGRNKIRGQVITFVSAQNEQLFRHIEQLLQKNAKLDQVFSRKRSYNKLYKDKQN